MAISPLSNGSNGSRNGSGSNGYLEFEKPLARIEQQIVELEAMQVQTGRDHTDMIRTVRAQLVAERKKIFAGLSAWETVLVARHPKRPLVTHYIDLMVKDFVELKGDRNFRDDKAIISGFGRIGGHKVMLMGHNKGRDTRERIENCFGMAHPEGYRKALLKMKLAEKFGLPIVCLIDTAGAYPGIGAEERGIAQAIAYNLQVMPLLRTPIVCIVIGEGGSGGALGIGVGDRVAVLEHAYYSVISPEGCAAILWKSGEYASTAAEALRLTSKELKRLKLVDDVIKEPLGGAHQDHAATAENVTKYVDETLKELKRVKTDTLLKRRYQRVRELGSFFTNVESVEAPKPAKAKTNSRSVAVTPSSSGPVAAVPMYAKS